MGDARLNDCELPFNSEKIRPTLGGVDYVFVDAGNPYLRPHNAADDDDDQSLYLSGNEGSHHGHLEGQGSFFHHFFCQENYLVVHDVGFCLEDVLRHHLSVYVSIGLRAPWLHHSPLPPASFYVLCLFLRVLYLVPDPCHHGRDCDNDRHLFPCVVLFLAHALDDAHETVHCDVPGHSPFLYFGSSFSFRHNLYPFFAPFSHAKKTAVISRYSAYLQSGFWNFSCISSRHTVYRTPYIRLCY